MKSISRKPRCEEEAIYSPFKNKKKQTSLLETYKTKKSLDYDSQLYVISLLYNEKNGEPGLVVDHRLLNSCTISQKFSIPWIQD